MKSSVESAVSKGAATEESCEHLGIECGFWMPGNWAGAGGGRVRVGSHSVESLSQRER